MKTNFFCVITLVLSSLFFSSVVMADEQDATKGQTAQRDVSPPSPVQLPTYDQLVKSALIEFVDVYRQGKKFVVEQAPEVIQQLLRWKLVQSLMAFFFFLLIVSVSFFWIIKTYKYGAKTDEEGPLVFSVTVSSCLIAGFGFPFFIYGFDWIEILVAPKLYLLEYASTILR